MKKNKYTTIIVRQKGDSKTIMTGYNTELLIDGKKMPFVKSFEFKVSSGGIAEATIKMYGHVEIEGNVEELKKIEDVDA